MSERSLQRLYEDPATPLALGVEPAQFQAEIVAGIASQEDRRLRVVDIGCGDGMTAIAAQNACNKRGAPISIVGFDWSSAALAQASQRGIVVVRGSAADPGLPLASASVDVVILSEVIEHLVDTDSVLEEASRVLVPNGRLVLSTPNLAAWYNRGLLAFGVQPVFTEVSLKGIYGRPGHEVVGHLRLFTRRALVQLVAANGFSDISVTGAPYHDVPRGFRSIDRLLCRTPSLSSILLVSARKPR
jgi:SAM-dependent methyltransferase